MEVIANITKMQIEAKTVKVKTEGGFEEMKVKLGRLTLEFDADSVDVAGLSKLINGRAVGIDVRDLQYRLPGTPAEPFE